MARAREPVFFRDFAVADTLDGRFDLIVLHAWLVFDRLRAAGLNDLSQALMDTLFVNFDEGLRDLGAGDMGMGRRMKTLADAFYGRLAAYDAATDGDGMRAALVRNLYRGEEPDCAAAIARYGMEIKERLSKADLSEGQLDFGPLP
ncbi:MAG: ubiquinol-cytochrome C chaperone [Alphaproteobacteria bacterium]|nr:ubiquinol-cytochrome C chaperone [Alphaproteobacteria bacterium]MBV9693445.1 ubiquinol-cytochrome C chaperone [Alphaproteobacteria bacterium]